MCGIAGIRNLDGAPGSEEAVRRMTETIRHRGPDGEGPFVDGAIALGHRRLAIIDPSPAGQQPMVTDDGRFASPTTARSTTSASCGPSSSPAGPDSSPRTDTEVVLKALAHWGADVALSRFNGMFALALWDSQRRELLWPATASGSSPCTTPVAETPSCSPPR